MTDHTSPSAARLRITPATDRSSVTGVIVAHREGVLAGPSIRSAMAAAEAARAAGIAVELVAVLDRTDADTAAVFDDHASSLARVDRVDYGDLSRSRNHGIAVAQTGYIAILDADDLWDPTWLREAVAADRREDRAVVWHPEVNVYFPIHPRVFAHPDMDDPGFRLADLATDNQWTSLSFARRETYLTVPYQPNRLADGFGYEDWSWNGETIAAGWVHKTVPGTAHMIRQKEQSLLRATTHSACLVTPHALFRLQPGGAGRGRLNPQGSRHTPCAAGSAHGVCRLP